MTAEQIKLLTATPVMGGRGRDVQASPFLAPKTPTDNTKTPKL